MKRIVLFLPVLGLLLLLSPYANSVIETPPADLAVFYINGTCDSAYDLRLGVGEYSSLVNWNTAEVGSPSWNDQISCMTIGSGIGKVIVFENTNFGGKRKEFSRASNNPVGSWSFAGGDWWNDKISSIKVISPAPANNVVFFQNGDYNGNYIQLRVGEYKDLRSYNTGESGSPTWNDQISSMKIGAGITKVIVYWDVGPGGGV